MWNKIQKIYVWSNQVRPNTWNPWANTIAYFPFKENMLDATWNITLSWTMVQDGLGFRPTTNTSWKAPSALYENLWINIAAYSWQTYMWVGLSSLWTWYYVKHRDANLNKKFYTFTSSSYAIWGSASFQPATWTWHNISFWYDGSKTIYSIDGVVSTLYNWRWYDFAWSGDNFYFEYWNYIVADVIVETEVRNSDKILSYYNITKWNYWL